MMYPMNTYFIRSLPESPISRNPMINKWAHSMLLSSKHAAERKRRAKARKAKRRARK